VDCPVCGDKLKAIEKYGVEVDVCPGCKGVWLDRGELEKILASDSGGSTPPVRRDDDRDRRDDDRDRDRSRDDDRDRYDDRGQKKKKKGSLLGDILGGFGGGDD
jgi:Zn-finger nucleic acid-binding protein